MVRTNLVFMFFSLNHGGHINYIGFDSLGIVGIIDASECPPTFGAGEMYCKTKYG